MAQLKVSHVMLGVASKEKSVPFYRDLLGLALQFEHEGFAFFNGGGVTLAISEGLAQAYANRVGATEGCLEWKMYGELTRSCARKACNL